MLTLLPITFDREMSLMQGLRRWKVDFKGFPTVYYMFISDNRERNGGHLKFVRQTISDDSSPESDARRSLSDARRSIDDEIQFFPETERRLVAP